MLFSIQYLDYELEISNVPVRGKIPGWRVLIRENLSVNKLSYFTFAFHTFHLKKVENNLK